MKNYRLPFLALAIVGALVLGSWPPWPIGAQSTGVVVTTPVVSSTASVGTSGVLTLDGKYSNCTVNAQTSTSTASIVVYGNSQAGQYGPGAPGAVNATFGSGGTITATTTATAFSGNVASLPVGAYFTWSGNSGTLYAWMTCTSATGAAVIASVPPVTLITPVPVTQASVPWNVQCTSAANCPNNSTIVAPTGALPVASAGASPVTGVNGISQNTCAVPAGGTPNVTGGNEVAMQCNANGQQLVHDPAPVFTALQSVTTPAPLASQSPFPWPAHVNLYAGSGTNLYVGTYPDTITTSTNITSATTTQVLAGVASQNMYVFFVAAALSGTNSTATFQLEYGQGSTCGTNTVSMMGGATTLATASSVGLVTLFGGPSAAAENSITLNPLPFVVPGNATAYNLCVVSAGTTISAKIVTYSAIHAN